MDNWVDTPYGKRYKEDYGTSIAFFITAPDENGEREMPDEMVEVILEWYMSSDNKTFSEKY